MTEPRFKCPARSAGLVAVLIAVALALTACSHGSVTAPGSTAPATSSSASSTGTTGTDTGAIRVGKAGQKLNWGGKERTFQTYRPARLANPLALVVVLHGGGGSSQTAEATYGWDGAADNGQFVVAYPDSVGKAWNAGSCCGQAGAEGVDDVGFVVAVVKQLLAELPIDPHRVYLTGFSNGAMLTYAVACKTSGVFAAYGPVSGTELVDCANPAPATIIHIHGTADTNVPYGGGPGSGVGNVNGPGVEQLNQTWRSIDQCAAPQTSEAGMVRTSTATCPGNHVIELISISGGEHHWPGSKAVSRGASPDAAANAIDATATIWEFFTKHPS